MPFFFTVTAYYGSIEDTRYTTFYDHIRSQTPNYVIYLQSAVSIWTSECFSTLLSSMILATLRCDIIRKDECFRTLTERNQEGTLHSAFRGTPSESFAHSLLSTLQWWVLLLLKFLMSTLIVRGKWSGYVRKYHTYLAEGAPMDFYYTCISCITCRPVRLFVRADAS